MKTCTKCAATKPRSEFYARGGQCKECVCEKQRRYHDANRERDNERSQRRYRTLTPKQRAAERARLRAYHHSPEGQEAQRRWHEKNRASIVARAVAWNRQHPEPRREHARRRRAAVAVVIPADDLAARLSMFDGCWICGDEADQVDHVKPIAKGGPHLLANLRPICGPCNRSKSARWPLAEIRRAA